MRLKELESVLSEVEGFSDPKIMLEQYPTSSHLGAHMLYTIDTTFDEIQGKTILDLGSGCGLLGIGAAVLGSGYTVGVEIDASAIGIAQQNCEALEVTVDWVQADVELLNCVNLHKVDTVIMNPPFGTKKKGIDMIFLQKAIELASISVYSLHKSSTRDHILKKALQWGVQGEVVAALRWDIPAMYKFHKQKSVDIEVDFLRFDVSSIKNV